MSDSEDMVAIDIVIDDANPTITFECSSDKALENSCSNEFFITNSDTKKIRDSKKSKKKSGKKGSKSLNLTSNPVTLDVIVQDPDTRELSTTFTNTGDNDSSNVQTNETMTKTKDSTNSVLSDKQITLSCITSNNNNNINTIGNIDVEKESHHNLLKTTELDIPQKDLEINYSAEPNNEEISDSHSEVMKEKEQSSNNKIRESYSEELKEKDESSDNKIRESYSEELKEKDESRNNRIIDSYSKGFVESEEPSTLNYGYSEVMEKIEESSNNRISDNYSDVIKEQNVSDVTKVEDQHDSETIPAFTLTHTKGDKNEDLNKTKFSTTSIMPETIADDLQQIEKSKSVQLETEVQMTLNKDNDGQNLNDEREMGELLDNLLSKPLNSDVPSSFNASTACKETAGPDYLINKNTSDNCTMLSNENTGNSSCRDNVDTETKLGSSSTENIQKEKTFCVEESIDLVKDNYKFETSFNLKEIGEDFPGLLNPKVDEVNHTLKTCESLNNEDNFDTKHNGSYSTKSSKRKLEELDEESSVGKKRYEDRYDEIIKAATERNKQENKIGMLDLINNDASYNQSRSNKTFDRRNSSTEESTSFSLNNKSRKDDFREKERFSSINSDDPPWFSHKSKHDYKKRRRDKFKDHRGRSSEKEDGRYKGNKRDYKSNNYDQRQERSRSRRISSVDTSRFNVVTDNSAPDMSDSSFSPLLSPDIKNRGNADDNRRTPRKYSYSDNKPGEQRNRNQKNRPTNLSKEELVIWEQIQRIRAIPKYSYIGEFDSDRKFMMEEEDKACQLLGNYIRMKRNDDGRVVYVCELCETTLNTRKMMDEHSNDKNHRKSKSAADRVKRKTVLEDARTPPPPDIEEKKTEPVEDQPIIDVLKELSNCWINNEQDYELALTVVCSLLTNLSEYDKKHNNKNNYSLLTEAFKLSDTVKRRLFPSSSSQSVPPQPPPPPNMCSSPSTSQPPAYSNMNHGLVPYPPSQQYGYGNYFRGPGPGPGPGPSAQGPSNMNNQYYNNYGQPHPPNNFQSYQPNYPNQYPHF